MIIYTTPTFGQSSLRYMSLKLSWLIASDFIFLFAPRYVYLYQKLQYKYFESNEVHISLEIKVHGIDVLHFDSKWLIAYTKFVYYYHGKYYNWISNEFPQNECYNFDDFKIWFITA